VRSVASETAIAEPPGYQGPEATQARIRGERLVVTLKDGRSVIIPLDILPGVKSAAKNARQVVELVGGGIGVRFPRCDEDFSIESLLRPEGFRARRG
jgi:hypothetical protein